MAFDGILSAKKRIPMMSRRHSGFNVYCGSRIQRGEQEAMENLARFIVRASFSLRAESHLDGLLPKRVIKLE
jgi:hypothetical protein